MHTTTHNAGRNLRDITNEIDSHRRRGGWRSRWAAIGAAAAVTFGGGGLFAANAASSAPSSIVSPSANGFLSVRPGDATGAPSTSSLNFNAGQTVPNSVQVALPTAGADAGRIDITYDA